jgi:hypothetical protein
MRSWRSPRGCRVTREFRIGIALGIALVVAGCDSGESQLTDVAITRMYAKRQGIMRDPAGPVISQECKEGEAHLFYPLGMSANLACTELQVESHGLRYRGFLFSVGAADKLVIFHEGHLACSSAPFLSYTLRPNSLDLIASLLPKSDVLYLDMPGRGTNCEQRVQGEQGLEAVTDHTSLGRLDRRGHSALAYFLDHIKAMVDELEPRYRTIDMVGLSGGGWVTTLFAALDTRVRSSISVAGTLPRVIRRPLEEDGRDDSGDWEQSAAPFYDVINYYWLYHAAGQDDPASPRTPERRHVQMYNEFDVCCFSGVKGALAAEGYAQRFPSSSSVQFVIVAGEYEHEVSIELVMSELSLE